MEILDQEHEHRPFSDYAVSGRGASKPSDIAKIWVAPERRPLALDMFDDLARTLVPPRPARRAELARFDITGIKEIGQRGKNFGPLLLTRGWTQPANRAPNLPKTHLVTRGVDQNLDSKFVQIQGVGVIGAPPAPVCGR